MKRIIKSTILYQKIKNLKTGIKMSFNSVFKNGRKKSRLEVAKTPSRTEIINFLLSTLKRETKYLEIGVRHPNANYNKIVADVKYSVDPGIEFLENPVDFKMTSNDFFKKLVANEILDNSLRFDVIFIDGLHLAEQVDRDIINALKYIKNDGFIVLHDCNPPTEWHARESHTYHYTPAVNYWNGTTWKAFLKWRSTDSIKSCCIDTDWGVGILSKQIPIGNSISPNNVFYEFNVFAENRIKFLNLLEFDDFKKIIENSSS